MIFDNCGVNIERFESASSESRIAGVASRVGKRSRTWPSTALYSLGYCLLIGVAMVWPAVGVTTVLEGAVQDEGEWRAVSQSLAGEARAGVYRGLAWLMEQQGGDGGWNDDLRSSALAVIALANGGEVLPVPTEQALENGHGYLLSALEQIGKTNNEFEAGKRGVESTALAMLALVRLEGQKERDGVRESLREAREYLLQAQVMEPAKSGYGGFPPVPGAEPDLLTTQWALEAVALTDYLELELELEDQEDIARLEKHYRSGLKFILDCQVSSGDEGEHKKIRGSFFPSPRAAREPEYRARLGPVEKYPVLHTLAGLKFPLYLGLEQEEGGTVDLGLRWLRQRWSKASLKEGALDENLYETAFFLAQLLPMLEETGIEGAGEVLKQWRTFTTASLLAQQRGSGEWQPVGRGETDGAREGEVVSATASSILTILAALGR